MKKLYIQFLVLLTCSTLCIVANPENDFNNRNSINNLYTRYCSLYNDSDETSDKAVSRERFHEVVNNLATNNLSEIIDPLSLKFLLLKTTSPENFLEQINGVLNDTHSQRDISYLHPDNYKKIRKTICTCVIDPRKSEFKKACLRLNHQEIHNDYENNLQRYYESIASL